MTQYDGSIRINTQIDTKNASSQMMGLVNQIQKTSDKVNSLRAKMDALKDAQIPTQQYKEIESDIAKAEKELQKLIEKQAQMKKEGKDSGSAWDLLNQKIQAAKDYITYAQEEMQQLVDSGNAFTLGRDTQEYANLGQQLGYAENDLARLNRRYDELNAKQNRVPEQFKKMRASAKKAFDAVSSGAKKSDVSLSKGLKTILRYGFGIRSVYALFNKIRTGIATGFTNLMGYSDSFANSVQSVKNSMSTLGNQIAAAFAPIVQMVVPWLNSLINALTTAMAHVSQFFAILGGKSTFTRAVQIQDKYNKALGGTAKAADKARGALAKFDDLDVLQKQDDAGGGGGAAETLPKDMFEEVPVDKKVVSWLDSIIARVKELKAIFAQGFWDGLGDWGYRWEGIKESISSIKDNLIDIWTDPAVLSASKSWSDSVAYMLGSIVGSLSSIGLTIATNLIGGIANYIDQNKSRIKEHLIEMFNIQADIANMFSELFQSIAYVFEAFASENGQQLTANIIGMFADAFMGVRELVLKAARDILNIFIQPFVDNKEKFRTALEGFLGVLSSVAGTVKDGIDQTFDKLNDVYDEHFKPFFDSVANGLSELVGHFLEFWNENVQPILEEWAKGFDLLWKEHIQPMIDNFIDLLGQAADFLKEVWENVIMPFVQWLIDNILPTILPIIDLAVKTLMNAAGMIADIITRITNTFKGILNFLISIFKGDWESVFHGLVTFLVSSIVPGIGRARDGIVNIFDDMWSKVKKVINSILGGVEKMANGVVNAINSMIMALNSIHFSIPDWVPGGLGGKSFGFNLSEIPNVTIPKLATGAVLRGGNPFMAIVNDQPRGQTNVETPLATIEQAVENVMNRRGYNNIPAGGFNPTIALNVDGQEFARLTLGDILQEASRQGYDVSVLGVT